MAAAIVVIVPQRSLQQHQFDISSALFIGADWLSVSPPIWLIVCSNKEIDVAYSITMPAQKQLQLNSVEWVD